MSERVQPSGLVRGVAPSRLSRRFTPPPLRRPPVTFKNIATIAVVSLLTSVAYDAYKAKKS